MRGVTRILVLVAACLAAGSPGAQASACDRSCVIGGAQTYLDALVSHDASRVRLDPLVRRTENGIVTAHGATDLRSQLETGQQYAVITGLRDVRWLVDGDQAVASYLIDSGSGPAQLATVHVMERFRVPHGRITEIEAVFCIAGGPTPEAADAESASPVTDSLCLRTGPVGL